MEIIDSYGDEKIDLSEYEEETVEESHQKRINQLFMEPLFEEQVNQVQSLTCSNFFTNREKLKSVEELQGEVEIDNFCEMEKKI